MGGGETNEYFTDWNETYESFDQMNLHENLLRGIYAYGEHGCRASRRNRGRTASPGSRIVRGPRDPEAAQQQPRAVSAAAGGGGGGKLERGRGGSGG